MTTSYTTVHQALNDINIWIKLASNQSLSLSNVPPVAQGRWAWIVNNWSTDLYERFKIFASGNEPLEDKLGDFSRFVSSYKLGNKVNSLETLSNFIQVYPFLDAISLSELRLTPEENNYIRIEKDRVSRLEMEDFQAISAFLRKKISILSQEIGLGDSDAAVLFGLSNKAKQRSATIQDLSDLEELANLIEFSDKIVSQFRQNRKRPPNSLVLSSQYIDPASSVVFDTSFVSYVPRPYEISLEHMARKYLGDGRYWFELVTVNSLKPPYIDEQGEKFPLLAPAAANNLIIKSTRHFDVPVGTKIGIGSHRHKEESRIVERVIINENETMVLFLSGAQDINKYKPSEGAFVRIYKPHTTRSGSYLLIPSRTASAISASLPTPDSDELRRLDKALLQFGFDIAHDESTGDIVFSQNGNFRIVAGLSNVRQAVLNALKTVRGELPFHPNYGINANIGGRFFGTTDEALIFGELLRDALMGDARFTNVQIAKVQSTGTGIALSIVVTIAGANQPLPLSFIS